MKPVKMPQFLWRFFHRFAVLFIALQFYFRVFKCGRERFAREPMSCPPFPMLQAFIVLAFLLFAVAVVVACPLRFRARVFQFGVAFSFALRRLPFAFLFVGFAGKYAPFAGLAP